MLLGVKSINGGPESAERAAVIVDLQGQQPAGAGVESRQILVFALLEIL